VLSGWFSILTEKAYGCHLLREVYRSCTTCGSCIWLCSLCHTVLEVIPVLVICSGWFLFILSTSCHKTLCNLTQKELVLRYNTEVNHILGHHKYKFSVTWELKQSNQVNIRNKTSATLSLCSCHDNKTSNFTPTQNERNNVSFTDENTQHSELNSSKYCLKSICSLYQDDGPSQMSSENTS